MHVVSSSENAMRIVEYVFWILDEDKTRIWWKREPRNSFVRINIRRRNAKFVSDNNVGVIWEEGLALF